MLHNRKFIIDILKDTRFGNQIPILLKSTMKKLSKECMTTGFK